MFMKKMIVLSIIFSSIFFNFKILDYSNTINKKNEEILNIIKIENMKEENTIDNKLILNTIENEDFLKMLNNSNLKNLEINHTEISNHIDNENKNIQEQIELYKKEVEKQEQIKKEEQEKIKIQKEIKEKGIYTRLKIPSVGVNVAVYKSSFYDTNVQTIVDNADSASLQDDLGSCGVIADHKHQGFSAIKKVIPNETYAYFDFGTYKEKYICTKKCIGKNNETSVTDDEGIWIAYNTNADIAMYTCNENWQNVTITYWQKIE